MKNLKNYDSIGQFILKSWVKTLLVALSVTNLSSCDQEPEGEATSTSVRKKNPESTPASTPVASVAPTPTAAPSFSLQSGIVSYGEAIDQNHQTGGPNSSALNPVTGRPGVAYYDKSIPSSGTTAVGALKYAQMNSAGGWDAPVVVDQNFGTAVCGSAGSNCIGAANALATGANVANIISLAYKPNGRPVIAYVFGTTLTAGKAVRIAEQTDNSEWSISAVTYTGFSTVNVTNDPIKAVSLYIDSNSQLHIVFAVYAATVTNSRLVYAFRDSAGNWATSHDIANIMPGGTLALGGGMNQGSIAKCSLDGSLITTSSIITGAGTSTANLHKCILDNTGKCANAGSWTTLSLATPLTLGTNPVTVATGIGGGRQVVLIDSANRVIVASTTGTTGIRVARSNQTCSTALGSMTWNAASPQITTTSAGVSGIEMIASSTELMLLYGVTTTSIAIAKANLDLTAGFPAGNIHTIESTTLGNDGVDLEYSPSANTFYGFYAQLPAAALGSTGNDIKNVYGYPSDISSTGTTSWTVIDQTTSAMSSTAVPVIGSAVSSSGTIGYVYFHRDFATSPSATSRLYYGEQVGSVSRPQFTRNLVQNFSDSAAASTNFVGQFPSLAYDSSNNPSIAFIDSNTASTGLLMLAQSTNGGLSFSASKLDGASTTVVAKYPSIQYYGSTLGIAYYDEAAANSALKFIKYEAGGSVRRYNVDGISGVTGTGCSTTEDAGKFASFAWTTDGRPVIAYQSNPSSIKSLKIAYASEAISSSTYTWTCVTLDTSGGTRAEGIDLTVDSSNKIHIAHLDQTVADVRYVTCSNSVGSCVASGSAAFTAERISLLGAIVSNASRPQIKVSSDGTRMVAFHSSYDGLVLGEKSSGATTWTLTVLDDGITNGTTFTKAVGQYAAMVLKANKKPGIFYRSAENWLKWMSYETQ
ncbi:MAG: hypothetical protein NT027_10570 [Proteobacteria bacterium]|nr:hypothetical protein [Pseudomonadota bacterium]